MRQVWITKAGAPEVLEVREAPDPVPGPGEVLIEVRSAGINFADIMARMGMYQDAPPLPCVVGYEAAGSVKAVGDHVSGLSPGSDVITMTRFNGYSSHLVVRENQVFPLPEHWSYHEGAGFPVNYLTAYQMLVVMGSIREGNSVLIHGAGGGVGTAASQIAGLYHATVYGTGSRWKHQYMEENGIDHPIDYHTTDFVEEIKQLTDGRGVDIILDSLGGKHWKRSYKTLRATGRLVLFGASSLAPGKKRSLIRALKTLIQMPHMTFHPLKLIDANKAIVGVNIGHLWHEADMVRGWMKRLLDWGEKGMLKPQIDTVFSFDRAAEAHHYIQDRKNKGKVCLEP